MIDTRPHILKTQHFERIFPHHLGSCEFSVRWPIVYRGSKTYNPDYYCSALNVYIEVATSGSGLL